MTTGWHFQPINPASTLREPIAGAFFAADAVSEPGEALVREGIQNSLDAALSCKPVYVRIHLTSVGIDQHIAKSYFAGAREHYTADDNGLRKEDLPEEDETISALIFEDFETLGLQGNPAAPSPPKERGENNFYHFFRAEGRSDKDPGKRGSWGLGKDTFFRASRINTVFGLTVRDDDGRRLLMGKTILKSHWVGDDHCNDGFFGVRDENNVMVLPVEENDSIEQFREAFSLERRNENDSGLSIVVPWFDPEIEEKNLLQAVLKNYSYAILSGDLVVSVETAGIETILDKESLLDEARKFSEEDSILPTIGLAEWAINGSADNSRLTLEMPDPTRAWSWNSSLFTDELLTSLVERLKNRERIAVRVPVTVRKKDGSSDESHFDVYMVNEDSSERLRPVFIRDDIVISDIRAPYLQGIRALVIINKGPLSDFLRDAENPSHTTWQGQQVKKDYTSGVGDLRFVIVSVRGICDIVAAEDKEQDSTLLADIFPSVAKKIIDPPDPRPQYFAIRPAPKGFSVQRGGKYIPVNSQAEIHVAYDIRKGNALTRYQDTDFQLDQPPIQYHSEGIEIVDVTDNRIVIRIVNPDHFHINVTGFDENRQIYINVPDKGMVIPDA